MSVKGMITGIFKSPSAPKLPKAKKIGEQYNAMLDAYLGGQGKILASEQQYQPAYTKLGLQQQNAALMGIDGTPGLLAQQSAGRSANYADLTNLAPVAAGAYGSLFPDNNALLASLNTRAQQGLDMGAQVGANDANRITQGVRSDWANRGLGASNGAQLGEALAQYGAGENLRNSRQAFALGVQGQNQSYVNPLWSNLSAGTSSNPADAAMAFRGSTGPSLIPGGQSYDMLNTGYNAVAGKNIAAANQQASDYSY